ncbi:MAG: hypothetical protein J7M14_01225, partial [Planctomycetes bacterium]|nr:hypothetical protein [Planctomycetota bacterium]
ALMCVPLIWYGLKTRGLRLVPPMLPKVMIGVSITLLIFVPWMWYVHRQFGHAGSVFSREVAQRAAGTGKWTVPDSPRVYLVGILTLALPWIGFLPGALASAWVKRYFWRRRELVYLFLWSVGLAAMLLLPAGKREHYLLPAMPPICLMMGFVAEDILLRHRWLSARLGKWLLIAYGAAMSLTPVVAYVLCESRGQLRWLYLLIVSFAAAGPAVAGSLVAAYYQLPKGFVMIVASVVILIVGFHLRGDLFDDRFAAAQFAVTSAGIVPADEPVASWGDPQAKTVYYFRRNIPNVFWTRQNMVHRFGQEEGLRRWLRWVKDPANVSWIFCYGSHAAQVEALGYKTKWFQRGEQERRTLFKLYQNIRARSARGGLGRRKLPGRSAFFEHRSHRFLPHFSGERDDRRRRADVVPSAS